MLVPLCQYQASAKVKVQTNFKGVEDKPNFLANVSKTIIFQMFQRIWKVCKILPSYPYSPAEIYHLQGTVQLILAVPGWLESKGFLIKKLEHIWLGSVTSLRCIAKLRQMRGLILFQNCGGECQVCLLRLPRAMLGPEGSRQGMTRHPRNLQERGSPDQHSFLSMLSIWLVSASWWCQPRTPPCGV